MMAGELWKGAWQIGEETTAGTTVAATRIMYFEPDSRLAYEQEPRAYKFATGNRENTRAFTTGKAMVSGTLKQHLSASEILEILHMGLKGNVSPTTPGGTNPRLWTFTPSATLDPATLEWDDGANVWEAGGCYVDKIKFSGSAGGDNTVEAEVFALNLAATSLTGALSARVPDFIEGWESAIYIDAFEGTPGSTVKTGLLVNWNVEISNGMKRKYLSANTKNANAIILDAIEVKATLTFEASASQVDTEFTNWGAATKRLIRLEFGQNEVIESTYKKFVTIDIAGAWEAVDLGGTDEGTRVYQMSLQYIYDPTNTFGVRVRCQNARTAAWA